jgi:ferredoxin-NADP reductase
MAINWLQATVIGIKTIAPQVREFDLRIDGVDLFEFVPGQFVTLDLPIGEKRRDRWRSYSIASAPQGNNTITLCISRSLAGLGTAYLFDQVELGSVLSLKGPDGSFIAPEAEQDSHWVMICTGTGIVPFRSMCQAIQQGSMNAPQQLDLVFGTRLETGILYRTEMEDLATKTDWFSAHICLSREHVSGHSTGYVHRVYEQLSVSPNTIYFICGWQAMLDEAVARLKAKGVDESRIRFELYG